MRVDCLRACILGHVRANQGRAASYKPTSLQRAHDLRAGGQECMRASNLRAYARRDLARMTARPESARMSVRYFVFQSFFTVTTYRV